MCGGANCETLLEKKSGQKEIYFRNHNFEGLDAILWAALYNTLEAISCSVHGKKNLSNLLSF